MWSCFRRIRIPKISPLPDQEEECRPSALLTLAGLDPVRLRRTAGDQPDVAVSEFDHVMLYLPEFGVYPFEARRESTGFIFNRVWAAVKRESLEVVAEGVSTPQEVDRMFEINTGSAAGPFRMMDRVGLDVVLDIEEHYCAEHPEYPVGPRRLLRTYVRQGLLGVKSGAGFYDDYPHPTEQSVVS